MLIRGKIPNKEPLISVGLILPIDKQNIVEIRPNEDQTKDFWKEFLNQ